MFNYNNNIAHNPEMNEVYSQLILLFLFYSMIGWVCETIWMLMLKGKFEKGGFYYGPYRPIYGLGAFVILSYAMPLEQWPILVFLVAMLISTAVEYFSGLILESVFHKRWWDYSDNKFQFQGRICLLNSVLFGVLGFITVYILQPIAEKILTMIPTQAQMTIASVVVGLYVWDLIASLNALRHSDEHIQRLEAYLKDAGNRKNNKKAK